MAVSTDPSTDPSTMCFSCSVSPVPFTCSLCAQQTWLWGCLDSGRILGSLFIELSSQDLQSGRLFNLVSTHSFDLNVSLCQHILLFLGQLHNLLLYSIMCCSNADLVICCWLHHSCIWPLASITVCIRTFATNLHPSFNLPRSSQSAKELDHRARRSTQTPRILARCSWSIFRDKRSCVLGLYHNRISQLGWDDSQLSSATCVVHGTVSTFLGLSLTRWHKICGWSQIHVRIASSRWVHRKTATPSTYPYFSWSWDAESLAK